MSKILLFKELLKTYDEISSTDLKAKTKLNICLFILYKKCLKVWLNINQLLNEGSLNIDDPSFHDYFPEQELKLMLNDMYGYNLIRICNPDTENNLRDDWKIEINIDYSDKFEEIYVQAVKELIQLLNEEAKTAKKEIQKRILQIINKLQIFIDFDTNYNGNSDLTNLFHKIYSMNPVQLLQNFEKQK